jgi:hypothetical protein
MGGNRCLRHQRGISMIGFLFVAGVLLVCALLAFRMIPSYIEYYTVQKALESAISENADPNLNNIRRSVDRKLGADYVDSVQGRDVQLSRVGNEITAYVNWEKKLPLVHNVSLLIEFNASASK